MVKFTGSLRATWFLSRTVRRIFSATDSSETLGLFWAIATKWSNLHEIQRYIGTWHEVEIGSPWQS